MKKVIVFLAIISACGLAVKAFFYANYDDETAENFQKVRKFSPAEVAHLSVLNNKVIIDNFLGVNAVYHGFAFFNESGTPPMSLNDRGVEFRRVAAMQLKIARTWYRPNWSCPNGIYQNYDWENNKMQALYAWLDKMKQLKVDVALQAGWFFPADVSYGHSSADTTRDVIRYADWVNESLHQFIKVKGFTNIKYLMLFTEPFNVKKYSANPYTNTPAYYAKVCNAINDKLIATGMRSEIKIVGPNSGSTDTAAFIGWSTQTLNKVIDIYSWHTYNGKQYNTNPPLEYDGWKAIADVGKNKIAGTGKPFWIDEYGASRPNEKFRFSADYGNYLAQCVAAFINSGAQSSLLWILFNQKYEGNYSDNKDSFYKGVQRWGLVRFPKDNGDTDHTPYPSWYAFSMMSKYMGGYGYSKTFKVINQDSMYVAYVQNKKNVSLMVINASHVPRKFDVKFAVPINATLNRIVYDPGTIKVSENVDMLNVDKHLPNVTNTFSDQIPSRGVSIYTTATN